MAISQFDDARIATGTVGIALCDIVEQFIEDGVRCFQFGDEFCADQIAIDGTLIEAGRREATRMNGVDFGERDEFFDDRTELFSFGLSRLNCFVIEQLRGERIEHGIAMRSCTAEMTAGFTMSHSSIPNYWLKIRREVPIYRPTFRG